MATFKTTMQLTGPFGLPPASYVSEDMIYNSMPLMEIIPGKAQLSRGLNLFTIQPAWDTYNKILKNLGFSTDQPIKLAFLADNFPTDTFTNDYGESFLQKFTDVASQGLSEIVQMTGQKTATGAMKQLGSYSKELGEELQGMLGKVVGVIGGGVETTGKTIEEIISSQQAKGGNIGSAANVLNKMVAGHRVDFPMVWRNSGFTPSYTATIRLYNPNPGSETSTQRYIIGPLAVILALAIPQSDDGKTYLWPFFHKIKSKGIYNLESAMITNITVIKGGDQQQIGYTQRLGIVDVRIDFGSLYTSMLVETEGKSQTGRPTLRSYLDSLKQIDYGLYKTRNQMRSSSRMLAGANNTDGSDLIRVTSSSSVDQILLAKNDAIKRRKSLAVSETTQANRTSTSSASKQNTLESQTQKGFLAS